MTDTGTPPTWRVEGSYFEVCNCEAVCPCRRRGGRLGGRSSYGVCDFALSWMITRGAFEDLVLSNRQVVLAGSYDDDEPGSPWRVVLYIDDGATAAQFEKLTAIFLGKAGGGTLRNFAQYIGDVYAVRTAEIKLDHEAAHQYMEVVGHVRAVADHPFDISEGVSCGIPGHDHPGTEVVAGDFAVNDDPLRWELTGRCGFASDFAYDSSE